MICSLPAPSRFPRARRSRLPQHPAMNRAVCASSARVSIRTRSLGLNCWYRFPMLLFTHSRLPASLRPGSTSECDWCYGSLIVHIHAKILGDGRYAPIDALPISLSHDFVCRVQHMVYCCQPTRVAHGDTVLRRRASILAIEHKLEMTRLTRQRTRATTIDDARSDDSARSEIHQASPVRPTRAPAPPLALLVRIHASRRKSGTTDRSFLDQMPATGLTGASGRHDPSPKNVRARLISATKPKRANLPTPSYSIGSASAT